MYSGSSLSSPSRIRLVKTYFFSAAVAIGCGLNRGITTAPVSISMASSYRFSASKASEPYRKYFKTCLRPVSNRSGSYTLGMGSSNAVASVTFPVVTQSSSSSPFNGVSRRLLDCVMHSRPIRSGPMQELAIVIRDASPSAPAACATLAITMQSEHSFDDQILLVET